MHSSDAWSEGQRSKLRHGARAIGATNALGLAARVLKRWHRLS